MNPCSRERKPDPPKLVVLSHHPAHGYSSVLTVCSLCGEVFTTYIWSIHGCGKKCPKCGHLYAWHDLGEPETVKHKGKYVWKVGEWLYDIHGQRIEI